MTGTPEPTAGTVTNWLPLSLVFFLFSLHPSNLYSQITNTAQNTFPIILLLSLSTEMSLILLICHF